MDTRDAWETFDRAQILRLEGAFEECATLLTQAHNEFASVDDAVGLAQVAQQRAIIYAELGRLDRADHELSLASQLLNAFVDHHAMGHVAHASGDLARRRGDVEQALQHYTEASRIYALHEDKVGMGNATASRSELYLQLAQNELAREFAEKAVQIWRDVGDDLATAKAMVLLAVAGERLKEEGAPAIFSGAADLLIGSLDSAALLGSFFQLARITSRLGALKASLAYYDEVVKHHDSESSPYQHTEILLSAANVAITDASLDKAASLLTEAEAVSQSDQAKSLQWRVAISRADACAAVSDSAGALHYCRKAVELATAYGDEPAASRSLARLASTEEAAGNITSAAQALTQSAKLSLRTGESEYAASAFYRAGDMLASKGRLDAAIVLLNSAATLFTLQGSTSKVTMTLLQLAKLTQDANRWDECVEYFEELLQWGVRTNDDDVRGAAHMGLAEVHKFIGDVESAQKAIEEALVCIHATGNPLNIATITQMQAEILILAADYDRAEQACTSALAAYTMLNEATGEGNCHSTLSEISRWRGDSQSSVDHLFMARECFLRSEDKRGLASITHRLAGVLDDGSESDDLYDRLESDAFALFAELGDLTGQANVKRSIGERYLETKPERSRLALIEARDMSATNRDPVGMANASRWLARISMRRGELEEADGLLASAIHAAREARSRITEGAVLLELGLLAEIRTEYSVAVDRYVDATEALSTAGSIDGVRDATISSARVLRRMGRTIEAMDEVAKSLHRIRSLTRWLVSDSSREEHAMSTSLLRSLGLDLCIATSSAERAREFIELAASALLPGMCQILATAEPGDRGDGFTRLARLTQLLGVLETEQPPESDEALRRLHLATRESRRRALIAEISSVVGHDLRRLIDSSVDSLEPTLAALGSCNVAVLQFACLKTGELECSVDIVWTLPNAEPSHSRVDLPEGAVLALSAIDAVRHANACDEDLIRLFDLIDEESPDGQYAELSSSIIPEQFVRALETEGVKHILVVPDSRLWNVPWSALSISGDRRLVDIASVSISSSLSLLNVTEQGRGSAGPALAWLADVADVPAEEAALRASFGDDLVLADSAHQFVDLVRQDSADFGTLVVSVHGNAESGFAHGLVLAPGIELSAAHILGWRMPPNVIFGACWAASLKSGSADDQVNLATLSVAMGASGVVGGIYALPDDLPEWAGSPTASILGHVYTKIGTVSLSEALWAAQRAHRGLPAHTWAGLVHVAGTVGPGLFGAEE